MDTKKKLKMNYSTPRKEETKSCSDPINSPSSSTTAMTPLTSSYNERIRPLLDAVDRLRNLQVMKEGIELPTIVVAGDQSSGKSSVLESLAGISLPRSQGICTRVPLIMRLQNHPMHDDPVLLLEYQDKSVPTTEATIAAAIEAATRDIAGAGKGISGTPLTLVVKKRGVPDLTMVDLPGITRVPVHGQPDDIYEQISGIIMEYITPAAAIILNVLSATVDFPTCESIRMSQQVDKAGVRTLAVVTKVDKAPEGLLEKVTGDDVNIGLGYICVRNRIGDETYDTARVTEQVLFDTHPLLSAIDKNMVGVPMLARRLIDIQATIIAKSLPDIAKKIVGKLNQSSAELNRLPLKLETPADAITTFLRIVTSAKESLRKVLIRGEFDEYPDDSSMHCTARLIEMFDAYAKDLWSKGGDGHSSSKFLLDEIKVLEEAKGFGLPNFIPRSAFLTLFNQRVESIAQLPIDFVKKVWVFLEDIVLRVLAQHCDAYPQMQICTRRAVHKLLDNAKERSQERVREIVDMERLTDYTANPCYMKAWADLMADESELMRAIENPCPPPTIKLKGFTGDVEIGHLREYRSHAVQHAYDMKMREKAYWEIVGMRLAEAVCLHIIYSVKKLVDVDLETGLVMELVGGKENGVPAGMLDESPAMAGKRQRLKNSIQMLEEANDVISSITDRIASLGTQ